jgi:hypothetical protein
MNREKLDLVLIVLVLAVAGALCFAAGAAFYAFFLKP